MFNDSYHTDKFYGKFRGIVVNNIDPDNLGRLSVQVPSIFHAPAYIIATGDKDRIEKATPKIWAVPCLPYGGHELGIIFTPPIGSRVWVEFEAGDINYPIWVGVWHTADTGKAKMPSEYLGPDKHIIRTKKHYIELNDIESKLYYKNLDSNSEITLDNLGNTVYNITKDFNVTANLITLNSGKELAYKEALETLKEQLDDLVSEFNTHVHTLTTPGTGSSGKVASVVSEPVISETGTEKTKAG